MRRAEMARRRRNLSEKRNEEVKVCPIFFSFPLAHHQSPSLFLHRILTDISPTQMETINKLLKKQAPRTTRKAAMLAAAEEAQDTEPQRPNPMFIRWVNSKEGSRVAVPDELLSSPAGRLFTGGGGKGGTAAPFSSGKMVEEVS